MKKRLYILGTRGIPAAHSGFETFAEELAQYLVERDWQITVYCQNDKDNQDSEDIWRGIKRVHLSSRFKGPFGTAVFDWRAMHHALQQEKGIFLTLGYNTGLFNLLPKWQKCKQVINMDGVEWQRAKWSKPFKAFFYLNYWIAGWAADYLIADHPAIHAMLKKDFKPQKSFMIPYGAARIDDASAEIPRSYTLMPGYYTIMIARPEPENNILPIIRAWSRRKRLLKLAVLGRYDSANPYHREVKKAASEDVVFLGGIYKPEITRALRYHAVAYLHGHSVGGTNPSLVEALGAGNPVIASDNVYNRWVAQEAAVYFKDEPELDYLLENVFANQDQLYAMGQHARHRHQQAFQWADILARYEVVFNDLLREDSQNPA